MTIFQVMGCCSSKFGGVEKFLLELCVSDSENKYVLIYDVKPDSELFRQKIIKAGGIIEVIDGRGLNLFINIFKFYKLLKKYNPLCVHFHFSNQFTIWGILSKLMGVKYLFKTIHGCVYRKGIQVRNQSQLGIKQRILTINGNIYRLFDNIICVSEYVRNQMTQIYNEKYNFECVYLGTPTPILYRETEKLKLKQNLGIQSNEIVISSIMFASYMKGGDILIKAVAGLCKNLDLKLIIIGLDKEHAITKEFEQLAIEKDVFDKIIWTGITDNVQQFLNITDIYVQPSRTEALSLGAVEALSYSIPVIGSDVGGLPEVSSIVFPNEDSEILSSILEKLIIDEKYRFLLGLRGYERWNRDFNFKMGVKYYLNLYNS